MPATSAGEGHEAPRDRTAGRAAPSAAGRSSLQTDPAGQAGGEAGPAVDRQTLTRKERRHRDTRNEILEAARQLLLDAGPDELSLRQVARRADFSPAALYTYFSSRDELVAALQADSLSRLTGQLAQVSTDLPPDRRVVEYGMAYMDFAREHPADLRCILQLDSGAATDAAGAPDALEQLARRTIQEAVESGAFAASSDLTPAEMTYAIWALVHGMASLSVFNVSAATRELVTAAPRRVLEALVARLAAPAAGTRTP